MVAWPPLKSSIRVICRFRLGYFRRGLIKGIPRVIINVLRQRSREGSEVKKVSNHNFLFHRHPVIFQALDGFIVQDHNGTTSKAIDALERWELRPIHNPPPPPKTPTPHLPDLDVDGKTAFRDEHSSLTDSGIEVFLSDVLPDDILRQLSVEQRRRVNENACMLSPEQLCGFLTRAEEPPGSSAVKITNADI